MLLALLLRGEGLDILVGLDQRLRDEFGVGKSALDVADGAPIKFLLFFVFEFQLGENGDFVEHEHEHRVAFLGNLMVLSLEDWSPR